jgi:hypothetical protein
MVVFSVCLSLFHHVVLCCVVYFVSCLSDYHFYNFCLILISLEGEDLHFFELNVAWKVSCYMFGVSGSTERRIWMQKILESLTTSFPIRLMTDYTRGGWCFIKVHCNNHY